MRFTSWTCLALLVLVTVACHDPNADRAATTPASSDANESSAATIAEATPAQVDVAIQSWEQIQTWVADQQGKVVVLDVWSTSCLPCVKEFPHFVELHEKFGGDVACASVNIDYYGSEDERPEDIKPRVVSFLTSKRASMKNFVSSDADEEVCRRIATAAIPAVLVYDRAGKLHTTFNNDDALYGPEGFTYTDDITPLVQQLLKANG